MCTFSPFLILFCLKLYIVEPPRDALDSLILSQVDLESLENLEQTDFTPFDPIMKRTEGSITDPVTNEKYKTTKGAPENKIRRKEKGEGRNAKSREEKRKEEKRKEEKE